MGKILVFQSILFKIRVYGNILKKKTEFFDNIFFDTYSKRLRKENNTTLHGKCFTMNLQMICALANKDIHWRDIKFSRDLVT